METQRIVFHKDNVKNEDIAIVERLHDMLNDKYKVPLEHSLLKEARKLFGEMYKSVERNK